MLHQHIRFGLSSRVHVASHRHRTLIRPVLQSCSISTEDEKRERIEKMKPLIRVQRYAKYLPLLLGLRIFYLREGHFSVNREFVIPSEGKTDVKSDYSNITLEDIEPFLPSPDDPTVPSQYLTEEEKNEKHPWPEKLHGYPLGQRLVPFVRGRPNVFKNQLFYEIGFTHKNWRDYVWKEQVKPGLETHKKLYGHTFVRQGFTIPFNDHTWPKPAWGFRLGTNAQLMRRDGDDRLTATQVEDLKQLGFVWSNTEWNWLERDFPALERFRYLFGHVEVPSRFMVSSDDEHWPEKSRMCRLGRILDYIHRGKMEVIVDKFQEDLKRVGLYDHDLAERAFEETVLPSIQNYVRLYTDPDIPQDFVVPESDEWEERLWGWPLGYVVHCIQKNAVFAPQIKKHKLLLKKIGLPWTNLYGRWGKHFLPALRAFVDVYGHSDVPAGFYVPSDDDRWPKSTWGLHLGKQVIQLRRYQSGFVYEIHNELDQLGFKMSAGESRFVFRSLPAIQTYAKKFGNMDVPKGYIVPSNSEWPSGAWGINLYKEIKQLRSGRPQNEALKEKYADVFEEYSLASGYRAASGRQSVMAAEVHDAVVEPCMRIYKEKYGEDKIPRDFVVPESKDWPKEAHLLALGEVAYQYDKHGAVASLPYQRPAGSKRSSDVFSSFSIRGNSAPRPEDRVVHAEFEGERQLLAQHQDDYWKDVLMKSFEVFAEENGTCQVMDDAFQVPRRKPYPRQAWGINLGLRKRHLQYGERYDAEKEKYGEQLRQLGVLA